MRGERKKPPVTKAKFEIEPEKRKPVAEVERILDEKWKVPVTYGDYAAKLPNGEIRIVPYEVFMRCYNPVDWDGKLMRGDVEGLDPSKETTRVVLTDPQAAILELVEMGGGYIKRRGQLYWIMLGNQHVQSISGASFNSILHKGFIEKQLNKDYWIITKLGRDALEKKRGRNC